MQASGKAGISLQENFHPGGGQLGQLRLHPVPIPEAQEIPGQVPVDPLDGEQILAAGLKDRGRLAEPGEQALEQHRPHAGDGLQGQPGEFVGHGVRYLTQRRQGAG